MTSFLSHKNFLAILLMLASHRGALSSNIATVGQSENLLSDPFYLLFILIGIAVLPFILVVTTKFTKIIVVLSIARQAIGTAQTPPNVVVMSLAMLLTGFSMYPVMMEIYDGVDQTVISSNKTKDVLMHLMQSADKPMRTFLGTHARVEDRELFMGLMKRNGDAVSNSVDENDFIILAPAFLISELTLAFQIGFLIYLPFLVIDMTVANLLMALGMQMLAPTTISLPFKILLFVLVDGWRLLSEGLARG